MMYICADIPRNVILRSVERKIIYEVKAEVVNVERETMQLRDERGAVVFTGEGFSELQGSRLACITYTGKPRSWGLMGSCEWVQCKN
jgi:hypothetical protein